MSAKDLQDILAGTVRWRLETEIHGPFRKRNGSEPKVAEPEVRTVSSGKGRDTQKEAARESGTYNSDI
jgi:hypothetical protein